MMWDFWSLNPESLHQVLLLMSDRGTPYSYRHMNGYGSHTFSLLNAREKRAWVKFHFKTLQGIKNFTHAEALAMRGTDPDWAQRDLVEALDRGDYPRWALKIQIMTDAQAQRFRWIRSISRRSGHTASFRSSMWGSWNSTSSRPITSPTW